MSWFNRKPKKNPPTPSVATPYKTSPATDRAMKQAKDAGPRSHKTVKKSRSINKG